MRLTRLDFPRAILLGVYALLTVALLSATPLWLDEVLQLGVAWRRSWPELLPWIKINPGAVPLPYMIQQLSLRVFGYSAFAARFPAALFSIFAGAAFIGLCDKAGVRCKALALALFLLAPLQFRYALEARGYSQGLFFTVASMWVFLELVEAPSLRLAILYFLSIALGLYFHPFLAFPVFAQLITTKRRSAWIAAALAGFTFLPWLLIQHQARENYIYPALYPIGHLTPLVVLHELTGGGYVPAICLLLLAAFGVKRVEMPASAHRLMLTTAVISIAGPLTADLGFQYFFAGRQFLIAIPALAILAAQGFHQIWVRQRVFAVIPALVFVAVASVVDFRDATTPRDDLAASAEAVAARLAPGSCVLTAPVWSSDYYSFFQRGAAFPVCSNPIQAENVLVVLTPATSSPQDRASTLRRLSDGYAKTETISVGHSELRVYRRVSGN